ncbi:MAG: ferritin-like domain-containing protein, partial [Nitrospirota bacterium]
VALNTEVVCVFRYKRHYYMAKEINSERVKQELLEHAQDEQGHADILAQRILQLGAESNFSPHGILDRSHSEYAEGTTPEEMIQEDLVAGCIAIDSYRQLLE